MTPEHASDANPFFQPWDRPFGLPPYDLIEPGHYVPAYDRAMAEHRAEIDAIANDPRPATFDNTVAALERAGRAKERIDGVFWNLTGTDLTPALAEIEREMAPKLADHSTAIGLNPALFRRVEEVWTQRETLPLTPEQKRLLELTYDSFVRSGARLDGDQKKRYAEIANRLATLHAQFAQNVLAEESSWSMILEESDLDGLPQTPRDAAARAAADLGHPGKYAITLTRSSVEIFLIYSTRRDLREKAFAAWIARGANGNAADNRAIINEIVRLRHETARMLGYETYVHYKLADQMAKTPEHVRDLLDGIWPPALAAAAKERDVLQDMATKEGGNFKIAAHDWRYYTEKARRALHDVDENELRPYLALDSVIAAAFDVAHRLFGLTFVEREGLVLHNKEARAWDVRDSDGSHLALFIGDYFSRPSKRSGAWMSDMRSQRNIDGENIRPHILNALNCSKAPEGQPTLISLGEAQTVFHEFGHALHGMMSKTTYPSISGTNVARDFVEFPSQVYEHWILEPEVLARFARHYQTGAPIPDDLIKRIRAARNFNIGFSTVEFLASAKTDFELHLHAGEPGLDVATFERDYLAKAGLPKEIPTRHACTHFGHVFSGSGYAAGYYSYLWAGVLDTDAFAAFEETGNIFDPATAGRLKEFVYTAGNREAPADAYRHFRGRDPDARALLRARGFA